ncbi:MAG: NADH-quinone oxidoreductase subunit N [Acidimicrobiia bacterium]|nr:NADH-quinone oxidoreductase subunit N [Acidimicrobiia bacterium]
MMSFLGVAVEVVLVVGALAVLTADLIWEPPRRVLGVLTGATLAVAAGFGWLQWDQTVRDGNASLQYSDMIALDGYGALAGLVAIVVAAAAIAAAWSLIVEMEGRSAELIVLMLLATSGVHLMAASANFMVLFLGLEILSISLYVMAGYTRNRAGADEAALKYFLLGAFASAVFLYGVALVFAGTGSLSVYGIAQFFVRSLVLQPAVLVAGLGLMIVGLAFKVSAVPFHMWAPDVYQGAPGGLVGFMAAMAKLGGFAALGRVLVVAFESRIDDWGPVIAVVAVASVVIGTALAIAQTDVKRMLAYSSVAHAGFILTGLLGADLGSMWFYLATYVFQVLGAFIVVSIISGPGSGPTPLTSLAGLGKSSPRLAALMALFMLAMGGIPLTAGFVGKAAVFQAAIDGGYLWVVIVSLIATTAGLFFYLRVTVLMYMQDELTASTARSDGPQRWSLAWCSGVTVVFGIVPWPLLNIVREALPL